MIVNLFTDVYLSDQFRKQLLRLDRTNALGPNLPQKLTFWFMQKVLVFLIAR